MTRTFVSGSFAALRAVRYVFDNGTTLILIESAGARKRKIIIQINYRQKRSYYTVLRRPAYVCVYNVIKQRDVALLSSRSRFVHECAYAPLLADIGSSKRTKERAA